MSGVLTSRTPREWLVWLEGHASLERAKGRRERPTLERMDALMDLLGTPQAAYPVIQVTGTNGKGSTARMISALLSAKGLSVGTYSSPDLEGVNERLCYNGEAIEAEELAEVLKPMEAAEHSMSERPSRFELLTAAAYRWFADVAVDVAVMEVGLGGRYDATNVADAAVAVATNVSLDHTDLLGPTTASIAQEKAGIIKPGATAVLGRMDEEVARIFRERPARRILERGIDFDVESSSVAVGGRTMSLRSPRERYADVFLPLHGRHQVDNAALALAAVEAFFDAPTPLDIVEQAFANVTVPGRLEVVHRRPLIILDGAHNNAGIMAASEALAEEFGEAANRMTVVLGVVEGHDPGEMLDLLGVVRIDSVVACEPVSPRAVSSKVVLAAARTRGLVATDAPDITEALNHAVGHMGPDGLIVVIGSLYLVGAARSAIKAGHIGALDLT